MLWRGGGGRKPHVGGRRAAILLGMIACLRSVGSVDEGIGSATTANLVLRGGGSAGAEGGLAVGGGTFRPPPKLQWEIDWEEAGSGKGGGKPAVDHGARWERRRLGQPVAAATGEARGRAYAQHREIDEVLALRKKQFDNTPAGSVGRAADGGLSKTAGQRRRDRLLELAKHSNTVVGRVAINPSLLSSFFHPGCAVVAMVVPLNDDKCLNRQTTPLNHAANFSPCFRVFSRQRILL